jgi:hypothetical protein
VFASAAVRSCDVKSLRVASLVLVVGMLLTSCGPSDESTASYDFAGTWTGVVQDNQADAGTVTAVLAQNGNELTGNWQIVFEDRTVGGTATGVVSGNEVVFDLVPSQANTCPYNVVVTRSGDTLSGTYSAVDCSANVTGTISVSK